MDRAEQKGGARVALGRRSLPAAIACLALLALPLAAGCGSDDDDDGGGAGQAQATQTEQDAGAGTAEATDTVNIASFKYLPEDARVKVGDSITFVNQDKAPHTAETDETVSDGFNTERLELGQKSKITFTKAGKFDYFCIYHRFMEGTVEVVE